MTRPLLNTLILSTVLAGCAQRQATPTITTAVASDVLPDERLGVDDVFDIRVIGEADFSGTYRVAVDGTIDYPYVGRVEIAGKRPGEVQQFLTTKLRDGLLVAPQVSVMVKEWNSRKISVLGQVNKPGPISYYPQMTIVDAIAAAGGFTPIAAQNAVKLRREINGRVETATLRVTDISEGRQPNVVVRPRDVLYIEERLF
jgi:protein involved in polysaccharide export with SLBB domain